MRILALAYGCEPGKGSEPGAGWAWARMLSRLGDTWVVTRANNRQVLERALSEIPERERLHFVYVDLPEWTRFYKRGARGARLYYMLWQIGAVRAARLLQQQIGFDLVWHLTMSTAWLGSLGPLVGRPFAWGPIGGGVGTQWRLLPALGARGAVEEVARAVARTAGRYLNPLARMAWRRASIVLVQNPETRAWLPHRHRAKVHVFHHVVLESSSPESCAGRRPSPTALLAGRLLPWKGAALAVMTMSLLPDWKLVICGRGPDEARLRRLAVRLGIADRVTFLGWVPRDEVTRIMCEEAGVLLFPSLHDEAGWVVAEAVAAGLPVVCLDRGGPPMLAGKNGSAVEPTGGTAAVVLRLASALREQLDPPPLSRAPTSLTLSERFSQMARLLDPYLQGWPEGSLGPPGALHPSPGR